MALAVFPSRNTYRLREPLQLKWEMSKALRDDLTLRNDGLESLNHRFALRQVGVKIYSYVEMNDTNLSALSTNNVGAVTLTNIKSCLVDSRSGKLGTREVPIEDEEVVPLNTSHVGAPIFLNEESRYESYIEKLTMFVKDFNAEEIATYHDLNSRIMTGVEVGIHQFYEVSSQGPGPMKILSARPCLQVFLESGPNKCMEERVRGMDRAESRQSNDSVRPTIELRPASEPATPLFTVTRVDSDTPSKDM